MELVRPYFIFTLRLDSRNEFVQPRGKIIVILNPENVGKCVQMAIDNIVEVLVVLLLFVVVDMDHSKRRAPFLLCNPLFGARICLVLDLYQQLFTSRCKLIYLDRDSRHFLLRASHVDGYLLAAPLVDELGDKVSEVRILMNLHNNHGKEILCELD